ncbi:MAG: hypothetical protein IJ566_06980 [Cardiobacteriaceae bacterium]|nr:hypothetical protein [Cardiobacteriaceae bacterium]
MTAAVFGSFTVILATAKNLPRPSFCATGEKSCSSRYSHRKKNSSFVEQVNT